MMVLFRRLQLSHLSKSQSGYTAVAGEPHVGSLGSGEERGEVQSHAFLSSSDYLIFLPHFSLLSMFAF